MKLAGLVCSVCGEGFDDASPRWVGLRRSSGWLHYCDGVHPSDGVSARVGVEVLRRRPERNEAIADERAQLRDAQEAIDEDINVAHVEQRRRDTIAALNRRRR